MSLKESIGHCLNKLQNELKVKETVFAERIGFPYQATGNLNSKEDLFQISSSLGVMYNAGLLLQPNELKYLLIETINAKYIIVPYSLTENSYEFFLGVICHPSIGSIKAINQSLNCVDNIQKCVYSLGLTLDSPIIDFSDRFFRYKTKAIAKLDSVIYNSNTIHNFSRKVFSQSAKMGQIFNNLLKFNPHIEFSFISTESGIVEYYLKNSTYENLGKIQLLSERAFPLFQKIKNNLDAVEDNKIKEFTIHYNQSYFSVFKLDNKIIGALEISRSEDGLIQDHSVEIKEFIRLYRNEFPIEYFREELNDMFA